MIQMNPQIIEGGLNKDSRGIIKYINDFKFEGIKRFYTIESRKKIIRAWQGHKIEKKYFYIVKGCFRICAVKIDNWEFPSKRLIPKEFLLKDIENKILFIPSGFANGIQAMINNSILQVFSNLEIEDSEKDIYRYDSKLWFDWEKTQLNEN